MARSYLVFTDSGGLQEEAPALGRPVVVLRNETERPEAIEAGTALLAGTAYDSIMSAMRTLLTDTEVYLRMARAVNPFGDGRACKRIADAIAHYFNKLSKAPEEFIPAR
jgi:UDP-N-acetylglucosamine 2-epimerase (non-hydrolysing)